MYGMVRMLISAGFSVCTQWMSAAWSLPASRMRCMTFATSSVSTGPVSMSMGLPRAAMRRHSGV